MRDSSCARCWVVVRFLSLVATTVVGTFSGLSAIAMQEIGTDPAIGRESVEAGPADETADLSSGAATLSVPISVPPGPAGLQPSLSLRYSSHSPGGFLGVGWSLPLGKIECSTRFGVRQVAPCTVFELDGTVLVGPDGDGFHHTQVESFQRISQQPDGSWRVDSPDGRRRIFGADASSRVLSADGQIQEWHLSETQDAWGNSIEISYSSEGDRGVLYPNMISYGVPGTRRVEFVYEDRPDPRYSFRAGVERVETKRLREIRVIVGTDGIFARWVLSYDAPVAANYTTSITRLHSLTQFGSDCPFSIDDPEVGCTGLPPHQFEYSANSGDVWSADADWDLPFRIADNGSTLAWTPSKSWAVERGDVNGDGLVDFVKDVPEWGLPGAHPDNYRPAVYLNTGSGFEEPAWSDATAQTGPLNESAEWTVKIRALQVSLPKLTASLTYGPIEFGVSSVIASTVSSGIEFAWQPIGKEPAFDYEHHQQVFDPGEEDALHMELLPSFHMHDIDSDGVIDLVMSVDLIGPTTWIDATSSAPLDAANHLDGPILSARIVLRNTGEIDPSNPAQNPWVLDPDLAQGMPAFSSVVIEGGDYMWEVIGDPGDIANANAEPWNIRGPCAPYGLGGMRHAPDYYPNPEINPAEACFSTRNFDRQYSDFNGDGYPDIVVLEPEDKNALWVGDAQHLFHLPTSRRSTLKSTVWLQQPDAPPGSDRWLRADDFELPFLHAWMYLNTGDAGHLHCEQCPTADTSDSQTYDTGVRFVDINRDGQTDVLWSDWNANHDTPPKEGVGELERTGGPSIARGVLINRGRGSGSAGSAWCASRAFEVLPLGSGPAEAVPVCPDAQRYELPQDTFFTRGPGWTGPWDTHFLDVNGDGWLDLVRNIDWYHQRSYIHDPNAEDVWVHNPDFVPPIATTIHGNNGFQGIGTVPFDADGDGMVDFVSDGYWPPLGFDVEVESYLNNGVIPDLLTRYRDPTGRLVELTFATAVEQRRSELEDRAIADAIAPLLDADPLNDGFAEPVGPDPLWPTVDDVVRWTAKPVLSSMTVSSAMASPLTHHYRYAQPRFCERHRTELGFRHVEQTRTDGRTTESYFYQKHGRVGRLSSRITRDENLSPVRYEVFEWEIPFVTKLPGGFGGTPGDHLDGAFWGRLRYEMARNEYGEDVGDDFGYESARRLKYDDNHGYGFVDEILTENPGRRSRRVITPAPVDETYYLANRKSQVEIFANQGSDQRLLSRSQYFYYGETGQADPRAPGLTVDLIQSRDAPSGSTERWTFYEYSPEGNLLGERVMLEHAPGGDAQATTYCYDGEPGCLVGQGSKSIRVGVTDALGRTSYAKPHGVFPTAEETWSEYSDVPHLRKDFDPFGRVRSEWYDPSGGLGERKLAEREYHDAPASGIQFDGHYQPFVVSRLFAEADGVAVAEAVSVRGGGGATLMEIELQADSSLSAIAVATRSSIDTTSRSVERSDPFACGAVSLVGPTDYGAIVSQCAAAGTLPSVTATRTLHDVLNRRLRVDDSLGYDLFAYGAESIQVVGESGVESHDVVLHRNANGGLQEHVFAGDRPVRVRDCEHAQLYPTISSLEGIECAAPSEAPPLESRLIYEPTGELRARVDPTASPGSWLAGTGSLPADQHLSYLRDTLGQIVEIRDPDAGTSTQVYDRLGRLTSSTDARGLEVRNQYDLLNRPTRIETDDPADVPTTISYSPDLLGPREITDGGVSDRNKRFFYDDFGRARTIARWVDGHYFVKNFEYDLLGRPTRIKHPTVLRRQIDQVFYEYDGAFLSHVCDVGSDRGICGGPTATTVISSVDYDDLGRVAAIHLPGGSRTFSYDRNSGRRTSDVFAATSGDVISYSYTVDDGSGGLAAAYDSLGNLTHVTASVASGATVDRYAHDYVYDARNRLDEWTWTPDVGAPPEVRNFDYDARGNLVSHENNTQSFVAPPPGGWSDDIVERAHAIRERVEPDQSIYRYEYDAAGNIAAEFRPGGSTRHFDFDHRGRLRCIGRTVGVCDELSVLYHGDGERAREASSRSYYHAGSDFRIAFAGGAVDEYWIEIHALGQRVGYKHVEGGALRVVELFPGWEPPRWLIGLGRALAWGLLAGGIVFVFLVVSSAPAPVRAAFSFASMVLAMIVPVQVWAGGGWTNPSVRGTAAFRWVLSDTIGTGMAEIDSAGQRLMYATYTPFGRELEEESAAGLVSRRYFAGHDRQAELGLVYMNARWMDPGSGTFVSVDPVVRSATTSQSFNGYAYVENNPISAVDPTGEATHFFTAVDPATGQVWFWSQSTGGGGGGGAGSGGGVGAPAVGSGSGAGVTQSSSSSRQSASVSSQNVLNDLAAVPDVDNEQVEPTADDIVAGTKLIALIEATDGLARESEHAANVAQTAGDDDKVGNTGKWLSLLLIAKSEIKILRNMSAQNSLRAQLGMSPTDRRGVMRMGGFSVIRPVTESADLSVLQSEVAAVRRRIGQ